MITKTLKEKSTGDQVLELQRRLQMLNFYSKTATGNFDASTTAAVKKFQLARGLKVDGIVGPQTLKSLMTTVDAPTNLITKHLPRTLSDRHIPDELRARIESIVFPGGIVPAMFKARQWREMVKIVENALVSMEVREVGGQNKGLWVGLIQSVLGAFTTTGDGEPWCMSTQQTVIAFLEDYLRVESLVHDSEHCMTVLRRTLKASPGLVTSDPSVGCLIIWEHVKNGKSTDSGHTEAILEILQKGKPGKWQTAGGNTSDSNMREGDGLYRKVRTWITTGSLPVRGFITIYPNDIVKAA